MIEKIVLKGRGVVSGKVEGEALVCLTHIHTWGFSEPGLITEIDHPQYGMSIKGKVLVFPSPAGSSDWGGTYSAVCRKGNGPIALINRRATSLVLNGAIVTSTPMVVDFDKDPIKIIETGDLVKVDAGDGMVEVYKRNKK